jgi:hypothetical protein
MYKCNRCNRHASFPIYNIKDGKLRVLCYSCYMETKEVRTWPTKVERLL